MAILLFYFSFYTQILPQALRVSDHYPVEVELLFRFGWKRATTDVQLLTPSKYSGELWQVKSKTLIYLFLVPDRCGKSWDTTQLGKLDGKFTERKKAVISKCILTCISWHGHWTLNGFFNFCLFVFVPQWTSLYAFISTIQTYTAFPNKLAWG